MDCDDVTHCQMEVDEPSGDANPLDIARGVPREVCFRIFSMLGAKHLIAASYVSKEWNEIAHCDDFWFSLAQANMPIDFCNQHIYNIPENSATWKKAYQRRFIINRRWETADYKTLRFAGHRSAVFCVTLMNDDLLATCGDGIEIRIWNLKKKKCEHTITTDRSGFLGMHFMPKTQRLVTGSFNGSLKIWDMNITKWSNMDTVSVRELKEAMNAKGVDYADCIEKSELAERAKSSGSLVPTRCRMSLECHTGAILGIDSVNELLASAGHGGSVRFWNAETGKMRQEIVSAHEGSTNGVKFFEGGNKLASIGHDGIVAVHDVNLKKKLLALGGHIGWVWGMYLDENSPNTIVSSSIDRTIKVWDVAAKKCVETISDHPAEVPAVHVDWDRNRMVSTSFSGKSLVHDTRTWKPLMVLEGFQDKCTRVAYSPDAVYIGSTDGTVRGFNFAYGM